MTTLETRWLLRRLRCGITRITRITSLVQAVLTCRLTCSN
jgi:hypothetical protein